MRIDNRDIGPEQPPFIVAEMSNNHLGRLDRALAIIDAAVDAGADAVKIQSYSAESLTIDSSKADFVIPDPLWRGRTYFDLYREIAMPSAWHGKLFDYARQRGITLFSSPFDEAHVALLETLDCPAYKIASFEAADEELLRCVAATGKPVIVSTGISRRPGIERTLQVLRESGAREVALLHCVSSYPSTNGDSNLRALVELGRLNGLIGLSDHSLSNVAAIAAVALGARVIEKHFTLSRDDGGPDAAFSLEPAEFRAMARDARTAFEALGRASVLDDPVRPGAHHGRSIYAVRDIAAGEAFSRANLKVIRPGYGLPPEALPSLLGRQARIAIERGTALDWSLVAGGDSRVAVGYGGRTEPIAIGEMGG